MAIPVNTSAKVSPAARESRDIETSSESLPRHNSTTVNMTGNVQDRRTTMVKQSSLTMEYFLETSNLDDFTAELLQKYDKDGNGSFSKNEVVDIIYDLREGALTNQRLTQSNKLFKRALCVSVAFSILLLTGMFGLSYAVAALTATTKVQADGTLVSAHGPGTPVATDSRAELHIVQRSDAGYCLTNDEILILTDEVVAGRQVLLQLDHRELGSSELEQLSGAGATFEQGQICFYRPSDGTPICILDDPNCTPANSSGRSLAHEDREQLLQMRRQLPPSSGIQGGNVCVGSDCASRRRRHLATAAASQ